MVNNEPNNQTMILYGKDSSEYLMRLNFCKYALKQYIKNNVFLIISNERIIYVNNL